MSEAIKFDISINTATDYTIDFSPTEDDETPIDMTGWTAEAQLRQYPEAIDYLDFVCTADENGFHMSMDHDTTALITYSRGHYDLFITDPDNRREKLAMGRAYIYPRTTR